MKSTSLRHLFPVFFTADTQEQGDRRIYFDSAATSQKPRQVIETIERFYTEGNANVHRASHKVAVETTRAFEQVRVSVQGFINSRFSEEVIWTKGATESINLVASGLVKSHFRPGQRILVSASEHHANIVPWQQITLQMGLHLDVVPVNEGGVWDIDAGLALITEDTAMVALGHVSNALGNINPVEIFIAKAQEVGALTLIDGAQATAHMPVDVQQLGCDFYVFSGHKMFAPTGIGVLYGKKALLEKMPPYQMGGEMIEKVSFTETQFQKLPFKFEAGTPNIEGVLGLGAAIAFIDAHRDQITIHEKRLYDHLISGLKTVEGITLWGDTGNSTAVQSFTIDGCDNQDVGILLDQQNIALRTGHHCAMPLMEILGVPGTIRVSLACYNTEQEVDIFLNALQRAIHAVKTNSPLEMTTQNPDVQSYPLAEKIKASRGWDEIYRQVMLAGKALPRLPVEQKRVEYEVYGCESQVWLKCTREGNRLSLQADSPSKIVRGLLAVICEPLQSIDISDITTFNLQQHLDDIGLARHLSPSRGNGLNAVFERVKKAATEH